MYQTVFGLVWIKKFSSPKMRNCQLVFAPKIEYKLVAESANRADKLREANQNSLTFPTWCLGVESNHRPQLFQSCALPLSYLGVLNIFQIIFKIPIFLFQIYFFFTGVFHII